MHLGWLPDTFPPLKSLPIPKGHPDVCSSQAPYNKCSLHKHQLSQHAAVCELLGWRVQLKHVLMPFDRSQLVGERGRHSGARQVEELYLPASKEQPLFNSSQLAPWRNAGTDCFQKKPETWTCMWNSWFLNVGSNTKLLKPCAKPNKTWPKALFDLETASETPALGHSQLSNICIPATPNYDAFTVI